MPTINQQLSTLEAAPRVTCRRGRRVIIRNNHLLVARIEGLEALCEPGGKSLVFHVDKGATSRASSIVAPSG